MEKEFDKLVDVNEYKSEDTNQKNRSIIDNNDNRNKSDQFSATQSNSRPSSDYIEVLNQNSIIEIEKS